MLVPFYKGQLICTQGMPRAPLCTLTSLLELVSAITCN